MGLVQSCCVALDFTFIAACKAKTKQQKLFCKLYITTQENPSQWSFYTEKISNHIKCSIEKKSIATKIFLSALKSLCCPLLMQQSHSQQKGVYQLSWFFCLFVCFKYYFYFARDRPDEELEEMHHLLYISILRGDQSPRCI